MLFVSASVAAGGGQLVENLASGAADFGIDVEQGPLTADIGDESGVDRPIFVGVAAAFKPGDEPVAVSARFGKTQETQEIIEQRRFDRIEAGVGRSSADGGYIGRPRP